MVGSVLGLSDVTVSNNNFNTIADKLDLTNSLLEKVLEKLGYILNELCDIEDRI